MPFTLCIIRYYLVLLYIPITFDVGQLWATRYFLLGYPV
jgi:hypothetical protein